uniref:Uncharacterized protein n=1 Tax=Rhizophagus irregularis (strain DAOM 181602 / DAOM 197198 / MUCL 43194) TaxID=747089 RepID=U9U113_RHIID
MDIDMSNVEGFQLEVVNPELERELSENGPPREESRVKGDINEFEINTYDEKYKLVFVEYIQMCHQLMITKSYSAHYSRTYHKSLYIYHIHGKGWEFILGDGQSKGLGLALYELDSSKDWGTHLMHIFKSCVVHFQRNLFNKHFSQETYNLAKSILNAPSQESIESFLNAIESLDESGARGKIL